MRKLTSFDIILRFNKRHKNKFDYSISNYINLDTKIEIICPIHGIFKQTPRNHLKNDCFECSKINKSKTTEKFINQVDKVHNYFYDYSITKYKNYLTNVDIICPIHGIFKQKPQDHIHSKAGCPHCKESKGEKLVSEILKKLNVNFDTQKSYPELKHKNLLYFDFFLPDYNICIEYDGEQHFKSIPHWGGDKLFEDLKIRDNLKNQYCIDNNIKLLRLTYKETDAEIKDKIIKYLKLKNDNRQNNSSTHNQ